MDISKTSRELQEDTEANYFAMCLLMPAPLVQQECDRLVHLGICDEDGIRALAQKFAVSEAMMTIRLMQLGRINLP